MKLRQFIERIIWGPEAIPRASPPEVVAPPPIWTPPGPDEEVGVFPYSLGSVPGGASYGSGVFRMRLSSGTATGIPIGVPEPDFKMTYIRKYRGAIAEALGDFVPCETVREWVPPTTIFIPFTYEGLTWEELRRVSEARRRGLTKEEHEHLLNWGGASFFSTLSSIERFKGYSTSDRWTRDRTHRATQQVLGKWSAFLRFVTVPDLPGEFGGIGLPHLDKETGLLHADLWTFAYVLRWEMVKDLLVGPVYELKLRGIYTVASACSSWGFSYYPGNYYDPTKTTDNQMKGIE